MAEKTPETKEEMEKNLQDLQLDPDDLDTVAGGTCSTCYSSYNGPPVEDPDV